MFRIIRFFHKSEGGFSLIETLVSVAISGIIALSASVSSGQVLTQTNRNVNYTTASRNAMNAVYWISRDAQMAQVISGSAGFPATTALSLSWEDWDNVSYNATYSLDNGSLWRSFNVAGQITSALIAQNINPSASSSNCTSDNGTLVISITSSVGAGSKVINVSEVRSVTARPRL
jgi:prepilin-type N-terminal cleavage/methylation domain-containing protein